MSYKKILVIAVVSIFSCFLYFSLAQAFIMPAVYIENFKLEQKDFLPGGQIKGSFSVSNSEGRAVNGIIYKYLLFIKDVSGVPKAYIDEKVNQEQFNISSGEKRNFQYYYDLPRNISNGKYTFRIALFVSGLPLGWEEEEINIAEGNVSLIIDRPFVIKNNIEESAVAGINFEKGELPRLKFTIQNPSNQILSVVPQITIFERDTSQAKVETKNEAEVTLNPQQFLDITYDLPLYQKPESYLAELQFLNKDLQSISNKLFFRWVVIGMAGEILEATTNQGSYKQGETAEIKVFITGPADGTTKPGEAEVEVTLFSSDNIQAGIGKKTIDLSKGYNTIAVPIAQDVSNPTIKIDLKKDNVVLANYSVDTSGSVSIQEKEKENPPFNKTISYLLIALFVAIFSFLFYYFMRKRRLTHTIIILIIMLGGFFLIFPQATKAAVVEFKQAAAENYIAQTWNKPIANQVFFVGNDITFQGAFFIPVCFNAFIDNDISFYITNSQYQPTAFYPTVLPTAESQNKKTEILTSGNWVKLGHTHVVGIALQGLTVEYNQTFKIPSNVPIGNVYARVWFEGGHWNRATNHYNMISSENIIVDSSPPDLTFTASPTTIQSGGYSRLTWESTHMTSCTASASPSNPQWSGSKNTSGSQTITVITQPTVFTLTCTGDYGSLTKTATVNVNAISNRAPTATTLTKVNPDFCSSSFQYIMSWVFSDPDSGDQQLSKQVQVSSDGFNTIRYDSGKIYNSSSGLTINNLEYGKSYQWRVKVWDSHNLASSWVVAPESFTTISNAYPTPDFTWDPASPGINEDIQFTGTATGPVRTWRWEFLPDGTAENPSNQNPKVKFGSAGNKTVSLSVLGIDADYYCSINKFPNVSSVSYKWKEIAP